MAEAQAFGDSRNQLLAIRLVQPVVEQFRKEIKSSGKTGSRQQGCPLERMQNICAFIRLWEDATRRIRRNGYRRGYDYQFDMVGEIRFQGDDWIGVVAERDRKSTRLNSSHLGISYAV